MVLFSKKQQRRSDLKILTAGHVDHGKSTLIAHLLYQLKSLPDGKYENIVKVCKKRKVAFEWAFLLDALQAERDQNITIDASHIQLKTKDLQLTFIDAPGHKEFLRNMLTGAVQADAALIMVDAHDQIQEQTKKHAMILAMLGIHQIVVVINKMDMVDYKEAAYEKVKNEITAYLRGLNIDCQAVIPISAKNGDNLVKLSSQMKWYKGKTIYQALVDVKKVTTSDENKGFRFVVQNILRTEGARIICGRVVSGKARVGDTVIISPTNEEAVITEIKNWPAFPQMTLDSGASLAITIDRDLFLDRGQVISHVTGAPHQSNVFKATVFWLSQEPLREGSKLTLNLYGQNQPVVVRKLYSRIDPQSLQSIEGTHLDRYDLGKVLLRTNGVLTFDNYADNPALGRVTLSEDGHIRGMAILDLDNYPDQRSSYIKKAQNIFLEESKVPTAQREKKNGQKGGVFWLTGLSGAGKSTISHAVEHTLFERGYNIFVLDGDQLRHGINANLGFTPEDRRENVRRTAEVAKIMADAGFVVLVGLISPYIEDRELAHKIVGPDRFFEVYVKASLESCEKRDKKGLYKKAREGMIKYFTGISAPYEAPIDPALCIETDNASIEQSVAELISFIENKVKIDA